MHGPEILVPLGFFAMVVIIGRPFVQALASRIDRRTARAPQMPADVTARLERMEQAIDSIALEVERISEGQRFTTKLLSERSSDGVASARGGKLAVGGDR